MKQNETRDVQKIINDFGTIQNAIWDLEEDFPSSILYFHHNRKAETFESEISDHLFRLFSKYIEIYQDLALQISIFYHASVFTDRQKQAEIIRNRIDEILSNHAILMRKFIRTINILIEYKIVYEEEFILMFNDIFKRRGRVIRNEEFSTIDKIIAEVEQMSTTFKTDFWEKTGIKIDFIIK